MNPTPEEFYSEMTKGEDHENKVIEDAWIALKDLDNWHPCLDLDHQWETREDAIKHVVWYFDLIEETRLSVGDEYYIARLKISELMTMPGMRGRVVSLVDIEKFTHKGGDA